MPYVKRGSGSELLSERFERVMDIFELDEAYKESIIGPELLSGASPRYWELSTLFSLQNVSIQEWEQLSLDEKGELIAFHRLSNMVQILERHTTEMKRRVRERSKDKQSVYDY